MLYNRFWFDKDRYGLTLGGGKINNPGRYLVLLPPINGATAASGTPVLHRESRRPLQGVGRLRQPSTTCPASTSRSAGSTTIGPPTFRRWFGQMLQLAFVGVITDRYVDFSTAQRAALEMVSAAADPDEVAATMRSLPPHPDVAPALDRLREAGVTLCSLTNSTLDVSTAQLEHAGIAGRFEAILSARHGAPAQAGARALPARGRHLRGGRRRGDARRLPRLGLRGRARRGRRAAFVRRPGAGALPRRRSSRQSRASTSARSPRSSSLERRLRGEVAAHAVDAAAGRASTTSR